MAANSFWRSAIALTLWAVFINDWGERGNRPVQPVSPSLIRAPRRSWSFLMLMFMIPSASRLGF